MSNASDVNNTQYPKYKTICKDVKKNNKIVQECKTIKVHRKLNGTKVPENKGK